MPDSAGPEVLGRRALNRAALERQWLLRRRHATALAAVEHLVGLQAQSPNPPYVGLWSRLADFGHDELTRLLYDRSVVRSSVVRGTQHLVSAADFRWLRPLMQPALDRGRKAAFGRHTAGLDLAELADVSRDLLAGRTLTRTELRERLAERWPDRDSNALAWSVQTLVPLVHTPPNGTWGRGGATPFILAEEWLGEPLTGSPSVEDLIRRYLTAFGPATVKDMQQWSGLTRLRAVVKELVPGLRTFRDEAGQELFDVPDGPLPDPGTPAPVRFLPEFDNLMVAYADRARLMDDHRRKRVFPSNGLVAATLLVDGFVRGVWNIERQGDAATLRIELFEPLSDEDRTAVSEEAEGLLAFAAGDAGTREVRVA
jgi:Winged helix DNA-binding domain